jgi:hypothetical protein
MKESFVFYSSFAKAAQMLGDKARLKLYDAVIKLGLCCAENETELNRVCSEIETSLEQNRNAFAQFLLIKPQIISNFIKYINGKKGKDFGSLGGAPSGNKNAVKNNPKTTPNENVNVNVNENVNDNILISHFNQFWSVYPKQRAGSREKAYKAFCKAIENKRATANQIISSCKAYAESEEVKRGFAKGCAAWLNDDRFNTNYETVEIVDLVTEEDRKRAEFWRGLGVGRVG